VARSAAISSRLVYSTLRVKPGLTTCDSGSSDPVESRTCYRKRYSHRPQRGGPSPKWGVASPEWGATRPKWGTAPPE